MKLLQILYSGIGGTSSVAFSLAEGDIKKKYKSTFIFLGAEKLFPGFKKKCKNLSIKFYNYGGVKNYILREIYLFKVLIKEKPEVIISHSFNILALIFIKIFLNVKIIYVEHTPYHYRRTKNIFFDFFINIFFNKIIYLTSAYKDRILKKNYFYINKKKSCHISNGITPPLRPLIKKFNKKSITIGMIGRFSDGKLQDLLIKSIYYLKEKKPNLLIKLKLVGDGENFIKFKKLTKKLNLEKNIIFTKKIKYQHIYEWFNKIDIYTHISKDEGLSTIILMAMANKKPIIASDNFGNKFLKKDKLNAILTKNNVKFFSNSLLNLIDNKLKRDAMTKNSFKLFKKKFSSVIMFQNYHNEINNILNEKN